MIWLLKDSHYTTDRFDHLFILCLVIHFQWLCDSLILFRHSFHLPSSTIFYWLDCFLQTTQLPANAVSRHGLFLTLTLKIPVNWIPHDVFSIPVHVSLPHKTQNKLSCTYDKTLFNKHQTYLSRGNLFKFRWISWKVLIFCKWKASHQRI